jgi:glycosyltransferase involved in cell wall biosynthesis
MRVCIVVEYRFVQTSDKAVWTDGLHAHSFWSRYLEAFDEVRVIARVKPVDRVPKGFKRADGDGIEFYPLPYYVGPREYLRNALAIKKAMVAAIDPGDAVILRVPSQLSTVLASALERRRHPYAVEVVSDPYYIFAPSAIRHPLRPFFRWWFVRSLRRQCRKAIAAAYVTAETLQRSYPPSPWARSTHYSSVELDGPVMTDARPVGHKTAWKLVTVGSLAHYHKAVDVQIDSLAICRRNGIDATLTIIGDGQHRAELEQRARELGLGDCVFFRGQLPAGEAVRNELIAADLFLLPSRHEGLPRAMIEAMSCGLPCIGSTVGGIPELISADDLVPPGDAGALARKIQDALRNPQRLQAMGARNLVRARDFQDEFLRSRRLPFYRFIREHTVEQFEPRLAFENASCLPSDVLLKGAALP